MNKTKKTTTASKKKAAAKSPDLPDAQKRVLTIKGVAEGLRRLNGNQAAVGRAFGVTRSSVNEYIKNHPELKVIEQECKQTFIDNVESAIYSQAMKGNVTAQIFILKTIGKDRGYVERNELTGKDGAPLYENPRDKVERVIDEYLQTPPGKGKTRQQAAQELYKAQYLEVADYYEVKK